MAKRGRQPMCTPERVAKICKVLADGGTDATAARAGGISPQTFCDWKNRNPEFLEAVKKAKEDYSNWEMTGILEDARKSLKTLINGQEYEEIKTEYENDSNGNPRIRKQTRVTKKVLPNPTAVIFALCNRDPEHWQNRVTNEINGRMDVEQKGPAISLANVPDDLLAKVIESISNKDE